MQRRFNPSSTAISSVSYDDETREMTVTFKSGRSYSHPNVPLEVYDDFAAAPSAGRFWNTIVKDVYV